MLFVCLFLFAFTILNANPITVGKKRAKEEEKEMVVYFFSKYCQYCIAMEKDVLGDREIRDILKREVIYVRVNVDRDLDVAKKHGVFGYPTTLIAESTGKTVAQIPGYIPKKEFKKILLFLKGKHYKTTSLRDFLKTTKSR